MDSFFNFRDKSDPQLRDNYFAIGLAVSMWAKIEENLCGVFMRTSGIEGWGTAFEIFFSLSGTGQRVSLIEASLKIPHCSDYWSRRASELTKIVKKEIGIRNKIVHGFHMAFADTFGAVIASHKDIIDGTPGLTVDQVLSWADYVEKINRLIYLYCIEFDKDTTENFDNDFEDFRKSSRPIL